MKTSSVVGSVLLFLACDAWAQPALRLKARLGPERNAARRMAAEPGTHFVLEFRGYPDALLRGELEQRGIRVLEYVPDNGLLVAATEPGKALPSQLHLEGLGLSSAGVLKVDDKISPLLDRQIA